MISVQSVLLTLTTHYTLFTPSIMPS